MGLLDEVGSLLGGGNAGGAGGGLESTLVTTMAQHLLTENGGVEGLVAKFQQGGLTQEVASWVGNGQNLQISPDQIQQVLGNEQVAAIAGKLGIDPQQAASQISQYLPAVISHLTPDGQVPQGGTDLASVGESLLKGLFNKG